MKLKCDFVIQNLLGNYCAVSVGNKAKAFNGVIHLNETGKRVFECIQEGMEPAQIPNVLLNEYEGVTEDIAIAEVNKVVEALKAEGLIA